LVGVSGGSVKDEAILVENGLVKIKIVNYDNEYDLVSFKFMLRNKSNKYLKLDVHKIYTKDPLGGVRYPLPLDEVFAVAASNKTFETPREQMELKRDILSRLLKSGELPPSSLIKGILYFEPGRYNVREMALIIRGIESDGAAIDFQNVVFQEEDYADDLRKMEAKKKAAKKKAEAKKRSDIKRKSDAKRKADAKKKITEKKPADKKVEKKADKKPE
jgi:hypothetical protein